MLKAISKKAVRFTTRGASLALLAAVFSAFYSPPAQAQLTGMTCAYALCLAGLSQPIPGIVKGGPTCQALLCQYFAVKIFDPGFDPVATAAARSTAFTSACADPVLLAQAQPWAVVPTAGGCP